MRKLKTLACVAFATSLMAGPAPAQTTTGTISGHVTDSQGLALPGVTVSVESPSLQGIRSTVTSQNGDYIFTGLPSGSYTVTFELSGFQRQRKTTGLAPTQAVPLDASMGVAGVTEAVNVVGRSADVLTRTAQVATDFRVELIATLPTNRDINAFVLRAPAVHPSGPNGNYSVAGSPSYESLFLVNGVNVNENIRGQANDLYIEDAVQEAVVATDGVSAEYGHFTGGVVNVVTKSGGNIFSGSFRDTLYNDSWRATVTGNDQHPFTGDTKASKVVPQYEYVLGGPVSKDRLWFFNAGRFRTGILGRNTVAPLSIPYTFENKTQRFEGKLTYSVTSNHRFEGAFSKINDKRINDTFSTATSMDARSLYNRDLPQDLFTINYNGILLPQLFVEARYAKRHLGFIGSGAPTTDLIQGTLLLDVARGNLRYWSPTFCGVCDPEDRDNNEVYAKGTYFLSTKTSGSHGLVFGYDTLNDKRLANNHQSGSDFRIYGTTSIIRGIDIYPKWDPGSTLIQWNPITLNSVGTNFRTHSLFFNDNWRWNSHFTFNLGVRWDKNHGVDGAGQLVARDSAVSPRIGVVWDPQGNGNWSVSASVAKYVAAINNAIADSSSAGGSPATIQFTYQGPAINPDATAATLVPLDVALRQLFAWFNANGGTSMTPSSSSVPGVSIKVPGSLDSANVLAYGAGISRQLKDRAAVRADFSYRDYRDFYSERIDRSTGIVVDNFGNRSDLTLVENTNGLKRRYAGMTLSGTYRFSGRTEVGGNYTISRLWGNFDGENLSSGPLFVDLFQYPEYKQVSWFAPEGDLAADQRHRSSIWFNYGVRGVDGLTLSLLQDLSSGLPYGAGGGNPSGQTGFSASASVNAIPYVTNPGYATPQGAARESYYYTARDAFRTDWSRRTDFAANYKRAVGAGGKVEIFVQAQVINIFNTQDLCACGATDVFTNGGGVVLSRIGSSVLTPTNTSSLAPFNPFTTTPVLGTNWRYGANWGTALNRFAYTTPRTFRISFGARF